MILDNQAGHSPGPSSQRKLWFLEKPGRARERGEDSEQEGRERREQWGLEGKRREERRREGGQRNRGGRMIR